MNKRKTTDRKQDIIDTAIKLISENGYHAATASLIAREAKVSQGLIFHYFKTKEELFISLLKEKVNLIKHKLEKIVSDTADILKKMEMLLFVYTDMIQNDDKFFDIIMRQIWGSGLNIDMIKKYALDDIIDAIRKVIKEGIKQGVFKKVNVENVTTFLFGMMFLNALRWSIYGKKISLKKTTKEMIDLFLYGISQ